MFGNAEIFGLASVKCNAYIKNQYDHICIGPIGSRNRYTTFYLDKDKNIYVTCGCFNGTLDEFKQAVKETHKDNELYRDQYLLAIDYAIRFFLVKLKDECFDKYMEMLKIYNH